MRVVAIGVLTPFSGMDCKIINAKNVMEANHEDQGYIIKDGIIVLCKDAIIAAGTVI